MSDRFKFRAWDGEKMAFFGLAMVENKYGDSICDNMSCGYGGEILLGSEGQLCLDETHILMQSTGLKDKNNVLIFEGDVVLYAEHGDWTRAYHGDINGDKPSPEAVEWNQYNVSLGPGGCPFGGNPQWYEIIGNIHEKGTK